jgi:2',3'-cyclic-nucleotide 2'-phosphodiesterase (5'-nucleotidase family)
MSEIPPVRVVVTHDFCCSYLPSPTSYGMLPGGEGLVRTVAGLREEGPTVWADAGDFAAPGALAVLSGGTAGFEAAADLGIDVGTVGNHEFDWGVEHLRSQAPKTGYPLLCANCPETGLPALAVIPTETDDVGFVGLTCPHPEAYASAPPLDPDLAGIVVRHAGELRASGAQWVVALIHDGVDWSIGSRGYVADPQRFAALCMPWARSVDAIVGTHTLGRWIGRVEGTPVVQPWPLGAELGVLELARGGKARAYGITPETGGRWTGAGSELLDRASSTVLGALEDPLHARSDGPSPLADFFAKALREAAAADAAAVDMGSVQPPLDGVLAYLSGGPVTEADLVRLYPWPDATVAGELSGEEIRAVARSGWPEAWAAWGIDTAELADRSSLVLAVPEGDAADHVERVLGGRRLHWQRTGIGVREAVRKALR